jgi:HEAT repeat protein
MYYMLRRIMPALAVFALLTPMTARAQQEPTVDGRKLSVIILDLKAAAPQTRNAAAYEISSLGPAGAPAVPALIEALNDTEAAVRFPVCVALREIGPAASAALPALEIALDDRNDDVASMAKKAIRAISDST